MKYTGKINIDNHEIDDEGTLTNPTMEVLGILVEVLYIDKDGKKHQRFEHLDLDKSDLKSVDVDGGIKAHKILTKFK